jgi:hypothetical protein
MPETTEALRIAAPSGSDAECSQEPGAKPVATASMVARLYGPRQGNRCPAASPRK